MHNSSELFPSVNQVLIAETLFLTYSSMHSLTSHPNHLTCLREAPEKPTHDPQSPAPTSRSTILESINEAKPLPNLLRFHLLFHHYELNFPHRIVAFKTAFRSPKSRNARASHPSHSQCHPRTVEPPSPRVCHVSSEWFEVSISCSE